MIDPKKVTACLVTRGNVDMDRITDTLPYGEILVWDNSWEDVDLKVFGRYEVAKRASNDVIYWQDDDVEFTEHEALMAAYEPDTFVSNNAHGPNPGGYDDLALQAAGALCPTWLIDDTWAKWFQRYPQSANPKRFDPDENLHTVMVGDRPFVFPTVTGVLYEADFIFGVLCKKWKQIDLPYTRLYADDDTRLCRQPWQEDLKLYMTNLAREIRDGRYLYTSLTSGRTR